MSTRSGSKPPPPKVLAREELESAIRKIDRRIGELATFDTSKILERWDARAESLEKKINATLSEIFGEGSQELNRHLVGPFDSLSVSFMGGDNYSQAQIQENYKKEMEGARIGLESVRDLLAERLDDLPDRVPSPQKDANRNIGNRVFIVHGRDDAAKESVARFVSQLRLEPIILHEQPNGGRTIIEKIEGHLNVDFAIVLLTPDDVGSLATEPKSLTPRARQNVVLELGLFLGALGRKRVCALHKGNVALPSDYDGVVYVPMDDGGGWRLLLAREMRHAGLNVDLNLAA